jgi:hypothetical protein
LRLPAPTFVPSRRTTRGTLQAQLLRRRDDAFRDDVAAHDAAEDVHEDPLHPLSFSIMLEGLGDLLLAFAPPPTSRKFAGLAAVVLDDVHRGHREAGAVHQAADVAVERRRS